LYSETENYEIIMNKATDRKTSKTKRFVMLTVAAMMLVMLGLTFLICCYTLKAESHVRYVSILNVASERIAKTIRGMEMSAKNIFDEVQQHLDSPDAVIAALKSKTSQNPDIKGYFAAFEPNYFPQRSKFFQPYIYKGENNGQYVESQVGSGEEDYTKSELYIKAKKLGKSYWTDPYYYYDGSDLSGHYCSFMTPIYDAEGKLACICGADMTCEWLTKELKQIDYASKQNDLLNQFLPDKEPDFYTVVLNNDGTCIAHPEGRGLLIKDKQVINDLKQRRKGMVEMTVSGKPVTVYYGPVTDHNWCVAVVVPAEDTPQPVMLAGLILLVVAVLGMIVVYILVKI
jgi:hypothetical protein